MSKTDKDKPAKFKTPEDKKFYKRHGGMMAHDYAGYGGLKCPCCGVSDPSYKSKDRQKGKLEANNQLKDLD